MNTWTVLKDFVKKNCLIKKYFHRSLKDGIIDDNGEKLNSYISDEEYLTCIKIWNELHLKNIGDYHDHYLKKDVSEKFINICLNFDKLDPCHYFRSPGLIWDAMLKMTRINL